MQIMRELDCPARLKTFELEMVPLCYLLLSQW